MPPETETGRTDADIISASLRNPTEFNRILSRHHTAVFRFVARRFHAEEAKEITSRVFIGAFRLRHRYDSSKTMCLPWLYGIAAYLIGFRLREVRRSQRNYLIAHSDEALTSTYPQSNDEMLTDPVATRLNEALRRLSARYRDALLLYTLEDLTHAEMSDMLVVDTDTIDSRVTRARERIRELIPDVEHLIDQVTSKSDRERTLTVDDLLRLCAGTPSPKSADRAYAESQLIAAIRKTRREAIENNWLLAVLTSVLLTVVAGLLFALIEFAD